MFDCVKIRTRESRCILVQRVHDIQLRGGHATLLWEMGILVLLVPTMRNVSLTPVVDFEAKPAYVVSVSPATEAGAGQLLDNAVPKE